MPVDYARKTKNIAGGKQNREGDTMYQTQKRSRYA